MKTLGQGVRDRGSLDLSEELGSDLRTYRAVHNPSSWGDPKPSSDSQGHSTHLVNAHACRQTLVK